MYKILIKIIKKLICSVMVENTSSLTSNESSDPVAYAIYFNEIKNRKSKINQKPDTVS